MFFLNHKLKLKLFLNLEWIFERLAIEEANKIYDFEKNPIKNHSLKFIKKQINSESIVLDLGCKYGDISYVLAQKAKEVIAVDYDISAINIAKKKYTKDNLQFINDDAFDFIDQKNIKFNTLILSHILEHLDNPGEFLEKAKYFFNLIYIEVPDFDKSFLNQIRLDQGNELIYSDSDHVYEYDRNEMKEMLKNSGISIIDEEFKFGVQKFWCKINNK